MVYYPRFQRQLNPGDPLGGFNCTCYSGAMAADYHTLGRKVPTGEAVRNRTGDRSGGTTLPQVDYSLNSGWSVNLDTRIGSAKLTWNQFTARINAGQSAILQGSYSAIFRTRFSGSNTFTGNHAILVCPHWVTLDPLCDGRYPWIYKYHQEPYPPYLLKDFAGKLLLNPSTNRRVGYGYVWAAFTKDNMAAAPPPGKWDYKVSVPAGVFLRYYTTNGRITKYTKHKTGGFSAYSSSPQIYPAHTKAGLPFKARTLVRLKSGRYEGWLIGSRYAHEI